MIFKRLPGPVTEPSGEAGEEEAAAAEDDDAEAEPVFGPTALRYETLVKATADDPLSVGALLDSSCHHGVPTTAALCVSC